MSLLVIKKKTYGSDLMSKSLKAKQPAVDECEVLWLKMSDHDVTQNSTAYLRRIQRKLGIFDKKCVMLHESWRDFSRR